MEIGTTLMLKTPSAKDNTSYRCKIIDKDDQYIYIDIPVDQTTNKTARFHTGTYFIASYVGDDQATYQFPTEVLAKVKVTLTVPALAIKPPRHNIRRYQRRQFVRVNTDIDIAVHCPHETFLPFVTVTCDLSGGGLSMILPRHETLYPGQSINIWIVLPMYSGIYEYVKVNSEVTRVNSAKDSVKTASLKFMFISPKNEQLIIQYCLEKQREERKKELM